MNCCHRCFKDPNLKEFARAKANHAFCDYCRKRAMVVPVDEMATFIDDGINRRYQDASEGIRASEFVTCPPQSLEEVLLTFEPVFDDAALLNPVQLAKDLERVSKYQGKKLIQRGPTGENLWTQFAEYVKHTSRYTVFLTFRQYVNARASKDSEEPDAYPQYRDPRLKGFDELWYSIQKIIDNYGYEVYAGVSLYRARIDEKREFGHEGLTAPTTERSKSNRMSPKGISHFYCSEDRNTCVQERHAQPGQTVAIGEFRVKQNLLLVNLCDAPPSTSIFSGDYFPAASFLRRFCEEVSRPVAAGDDQVEYIPTQILCDYIQHNVWSREFHGIRYPSAAKPGGFSIVLFRGPGISLGPNPWLDFVDPPCYETIP